MTTTDEWIKTCINKKRYPSENFADNVIKKVLADRGTTLYKYFCPHCSAWHLTKTPRIEIMYSEKISLLQAEITSKDEEIDKLNRKLKEVDSAGTIDKAELKRLRAISYNKQLLQANESLRARNNNLKKDNGELISKLAQLQVKSI